MNMKRIAIKGLHQAELEVSSINEELDMDEVLTKTEYSFISAGTELSIYSGLEPAVSVPGSWCAYPWNSGYANVGTVIKVGSHVTRAKVGQRVFTFGQHMSVVKQSERMLFIEVPDAIDSETAVSSRMAGVSATAIMQCDIPLNAWVAVYGLGMVGNLAAQMFQNLGCRVIGIEPNEKRRQLAQACNIHHTIGGSPDEVQKKLYEITGGNGVHIAVDAVGHSAVVMQALRSVARFGQILLLGSPRAAVEMNVTELLTQIHGQSITMRGTFEWCLPVYSELSNMESHYKKHELIFSWIDQGKLVIKPLISHCMRPEQIKEAYDGLLHQPELYTGVVLDWR